MLKNIPSILSPELNLAQMRDLSFGIPLVYGRSPLMLTERCFIRENFGIEMEEGKIFCEYSEKNNQCIKERCPFNPFNNKD